MTQYLGHRVLGCHPFLRTITKTIVDLVLLFSHISGIPCVLRLWGGPCHMIFSVHTITQNSRQNAICQLRNRWNICSLLFFGWITWPSFIQSSYQSSMGNLVNTQLECQYDPSPHTCIIHWASICFLHICRRGLRVFYWSYSKQQASFK